MLPSTAPIKIQPKLWVHFGDLGPAASSARLATFIRQRCHHLTVNCLIGAPHIKCSMISSAE